MNIAVNPNGGRTTGKPITDPIRVMVVDDAIVVRGLLTRWIDENPKLAVVASHRNGRLAVEDILRTDPDVVILDIEMPEMDGLTALPLMLKAKRDLVVVMASTLTKRNAEISLKALSLGATDYVSKPDSNRGVTTSKTFREELIDKVISLGEQAKRRRAAGARSAERPARARASTHPDRIASHPVAKTKAPIPVRKSSTALLPAKALVVGSSTGGPQALTALFGKIGSELSDIPVFIVQHMPPTFTAILAEHISKASGRPAGEGQDGEIVGPGRIYVAPGGKHMVLGKSGRDTIIRIKDGPPVNFCKPAVDPMFESAAEVFRSTLLGVVLTGMGHDGAGGAKAIMNAGGQVIAQDEASSVVWGMPGAVVEADAYTDVLSLTDIGDRIARVQKGKRT